MLRPTSTCRVLLLLLLSIIIDNVDWVSLVGAVILLVIIIVVRALSVSPSRAGLSAGLHEHFLFALIGALHLIVLGVDRAELGRLSDLTACMARLSRQLATARCLITVIQIHKAKFLFRQRVELGEDILQLARACIICGRFVWRLFHDESIA